MISSHKIIGGSMWKFTLYSFLVLATICFPIYAQDQQAAILVDTFIEKNDEYSALVDKMQAFLNRFDKEPRTSRVAITFLYRFKFEGGCVDGGVVADKSSEDIVRYILKQDKTASERISYIPGGMSVRAEVGFWIVPDGAELPKKEDRDFNPPCCCASIQVNGKTSVPSDVKMLVFSVDLAGTSATTPPNPKWIVSAGTIISGQGTNKIVVDVRGVDAKLVTAEVKITLPNVECNCPVTSSHTTKILPK
jgi:hypothetical protein